MTGNNRAINVAHYKHQATLQPPPGFYRLVNASISPNGPRGLLVHNETAAIIGNYGSMWIGPLVEFTDPVEWHLLLPDGSVPSEQPTCRGSKSNLFVQDQWFIFDLADIASPQHT